jgi:chromosome segregation ATPase
MNPMSSLQKTTHQLGTLKHYTQKVYRLRYDINTLNQKIKDHRLQLHQAKTVLDVQKEYLTETLMATQTDPAYPARFIQLYYDIARREDEIQEILHDLYESKKDYAYQLQEIQEIHTKMLQLIQESQTSAKELDVNYNFEMCFKAIEQTVPTVPTKGV